MNVYRVVLILIEMGILGFFRMSALIYIGFRIFSFFVSRRRRFREGFMVLRFLKFSLMFVGRGCGFGELVFF